MTENNKKLLAKIQQLETCQAEAEVQLGALRQDNSRLSTETENLNSTIHSQSALIIGLRSTVQRLNVRKIVRRFVSYAMLTVCLNCLSSATRSWSTTFAVR
jgi:hypothetical protein